jgi:hypothetical protein
MVAGIVIVLVVVVVSSVLLLLLLFVRKTCYVGLPTTYILCLPRVNSNVRGIPCVQLLTCTYDWRFCSYYVRSLDLPSLQFQYSQMQCFSSQRCHI